MTVRLRTNERHKGEMSVFEALRFLWKSNEAAEAERLNKQRAALRRAWGLDEDDPVFAEDSIAFAPESTGDVSLLDRRMWHSRLFRIAEKGRAQAALDFSRDVRDLMQESLTLGISNEDARATAGRVFETAVRQAVADQHISLSEFAWLHALSNALNLSEETAEQIVRQVVDEAERFFDTQIQGFSPVNGRETQSAVTFAGLRSG